MLLQKKKKILVLSLVDFPIYLSTHLSIYLSTHLSVRPSVCAQTIFFNVHFCDVLFSARCLQSDRIAGQASKKRWTSSSQTPGSTESFTEQVLCCHPRGKGCLSPSNISSLDCDFASFKTVCWILFSWNMLHSFEKYLKETVKIFTNLYLFSCTDFTEH